MRAAEAKHWRRVEEEPWSGPATALVEDGFGRMGLRSEEELLPAALYGYAKAVEGEAVAFPDARQTLSRLREEGYGLGLLSNTWWAAGWHDVDLAAQGLADLLDGVLYTSDLPYSKPHPAVFLEIAARLGMPPAECVMVDDNMLADVHGPSRKASSLRPLSSAWRSCRGYFARGERRRPFLEVCDAL